MGIVRDLYMARKMSAGLKVPAPTLALLIKRLALAPSGGGTYGPADVVSFVTGVAKEVQSLLVSMQPIQSLNGYSHPWPAGGGKNLVDFENQSLPYSSNSYVLLDFGEDKTFSALVLTFFMDGAVYSAASAAICDFLKNDGTHQYRVAGSFGMTANVSNTGAFSKSETNITFRKLVVYLGSSYGAYTAGTCSVQLEEGSTATPYAPYENLCPISGRTGLSVYVGPTQDQQDATTYSVDWTSEAGTVYGGTDNPVTGDLVSKYGMVDLGTLSASGWIYDSNRKGFTHTFAASANANIMCSAYPIGTYADWANASKTNLIFYVKASNAIYLKTPDYTDGASLSAALSGVQMVYEFATPLTYQLTPQEVETLKGKNYVWSDAGPVTVKI